MRVLVGGLILTCLTLVAGTCPHDEAGLEDWSLGASWASGSVPTADSQVVIPAGKKIVLDTSPPCLASITIETGGVLVWGDEDDLVLCTDYIHIKGRFQIGSETCRFTKKAHIKLTGESNSPNVVSGFGRKFIGVDANGVLELHGAEKPAWTKLIQTVEAAKDTCGHIFSSKDSEYEREDASGLYVSLFNTDGTLRDFSIFKSSVANDEPRFERFLQDAPADVIIAVAVQGLPGLAGLEKVFTSLEQVGGIASTKLRNLQDGDAYAFITKKGASASTSEKHVANPKNLTVSTGYLTVDSDGLQFAVESEVEHGSSRQRGVDFRVLTQEVAYPCVKVNADVSSWNEVGNKIVVASSDYDWRQAEEMTVKDCPGCDDNEVCFTEPFQFKHFGQVTEGVDERAEVGLLTRNILIEGVVGDECAIHDDTDQLMCTRFKMETFGGHLKVVKGFTAAHVQGVELYHMGQARNVGTYPLHFHMCDDVIGNWFRHNTIYDSFTRCVTIHGTDSAEVSFNVCFKHRGHGFFLEDSAEQLNVFDGNLCLGTMHGHHLLSDMKREWCETEDKPFCDALSSFWITHPNNRFINNAAAGSDGVGYWILASKNPLTLSRARQEILQNVTKNHAIRTPILEFRNNSAHSHKTGLRIDKKISDGTDISNGQTVKENGVIGAAVTHNPQDENGNPLKSYLYSFTSYKTKEQNVWTKAGIVIMDGFSLADSTRGITMAAAKSSTYAQIQNSLFVGETDNVAPEIDDEVIQGVVFYQGPGFVRHSHFNNYVKKTVDGDVRNAGALSVKRRNPYPPKANSQIQNVTFGFCDVAEGNYVFNGAPDAPGFKNKDGNRQINFRDIDGSLTDTSGAQVVPNSRFHTTNKCLSVSSWNLQVCPHDYAKMVFEGNGALDTLNKNTPMYMRRDDRPTDSFALEGERGNIYLVIKNRSYTAYFYGPAPFKLKVSSRNLESDEYVRVGLCYPKDVDSFDIDGTHISKNNPAISVSTLAELESDTTGRAYHWDSARGILSVKVYSKKDRVDGEVCPGYTCPNMVIERIGGSNDTFDCTDEAYDGTYNRTEDYTEAVPTLKACNKVSHEGYGAPVVENFFTNNVNQLTCPPNVTHEGRGTPALQGCYTDKNTFRDLPHERIQLFRSMTVDFCIERCYYRGYVYAALQNGNECRCGDVFGAFGKSSACTKKCPGDSSKICGGSMANSVYSTGNAELTPLQQCGTDNAGVVINNMCYYLTTEKYSYPNAQGACVALGGDLATINSADTQFAVERYMRPKRKHAWIGLNDARTEGTYEYINGAAYSGYRNFEPGQGTSTSSDGVVLESATIYRWDDRHVGSETRALCQLPLPVSPVAPAQCGYHNNGLQLGGGTCYAVVNTKLGFGDANYACFVRRGRLASADTPEKLAAIQNHVFIYGEFGKDYWVQTQPSHTFTELDDILLYATRNTSNTKNGAVCEIESFASSGACSTGWAQNNTHCYLFSSHFAKNYDRAKSICNFDDSEVVTVRTASENSFVNSLAKAGGSNPNFFIGFVYDDAIGDFVWEGENTAPSYTNWRDGHGVSNIVNGGNCTRLHSSSEQWNNRKCSKSGRVMCKAPTMS